MAPLSDLSIGFIVGGSVIFALIILCFVIWKLLDSKRHAKSRGESPHAGQTRAETGAANADTGNRRNGKDSTATDSVYVEISADNEHRRAAALETTHSPATEMNSFPAYDNTDDSGYCEGQACVGGSTVYARLHEAQNHMENEYSGFTDEDSGQGSHARGNSVSADSDGDNENYSSMATATRKISSNQGDPDYLETTPRSALASEGDANYYSVTVPHVSIIEIHRSSEGKSNEDLTTERDDASDSPCDNDELSVEETPL